MTLTINTSIASLGAQRNLGRSTMASANSIAKLSSGSRIVTAKDDAASLAIASGLKLDLAALRAANANVKQATSILQIADGAYSQLSNVLNRMQTLSSMAQSTTVSDTQRGFLNSEYSLLLNELNRIAASAEFNGVNLLGTTASLDVDIAAGGGDIDTAAGFVAYEIDQNLRAAGESFTVDYHDATATFVITVLDAGGDVIGSQSIALGDIAGNPFDIGGNNALQEGTLYTLNFGNMGIKITLNHTFDATAAIDSGTDAAEVDIVAGTGGTAAMMTFLVGVNTTDTVSIALQVGNAGALGVAATGVGSLGNAQTAAVAIKSAVETLNTARSQVGATLSRLEFAGANVAVQIENSEAARSVLEDVDVAEEFTKFSSAQVLVQAGVAILAQANQQSSLLLRLFQ